LVNDIPKHLQEQESFDQNSGVPTAQDPARGCRSGPSRRWSPASRAAVLLWRRATPGPAGRGPGFLRGRFASTGEAGAGTSVGSVPHARISAAHGGRRSAPPTQQRSLSRAARVTPRMPRHSHRRRADAKRPPGASELRTQAGAGCGTGGRAGRVRAERGDPPASERGTRALPQTLTCK